MKIFATFLLLAVPAVLAGNFAKMWAELKHELEDTRSNDGHFVNSEKDSESEMDSWGDKDNKGWGDKDNKGWGDKDNKGWGDMDNKGWGDRDNKGWDHHRSRGWGDDRESRNDDDGKDSVKDMMNDFRQYIRRKAMRENEEKITKAEIYQEMEKVQMKKYLTEKLEQLNEAYEQESMKHVFLTTWRFLALCQGVSNAKELLERLDSGNFSETEQPALTNSTDNWNVNGSAPVDQSGSNSELQVRWWDQMEHTDKMKYVLHGLLQVMCGAAQGLAGDVETIESQINDCKHGIIPCDLK
ncbi:hypothetical protein Btru_049639 [Bulinus truncatus]|nr:hypothetical protein Btru_049639 [Bulinus truncatus]